MSSIKLPLYIWHNQKEVEFPLPDDWKIKVHNITGYNKPALKPGQIKAAIASPIGTAPFRSENKKEVEFPLTDDWKIKVHNITGYNKPALKPGQIKAAIASPIGTAPLRELAKGKKQVVII